SANPDIPLEEAVIWTGDMKTTSIAKADLRTTDREAPLPAASPSPALPIEKPQRGPSRGPSYRGRALRFVLILIVAVAAWWGSGYVFAYTDDAYLTSDVVSITPEVSGPIDAVHVADNQWVTRGTTLFTIDRVPFALALEQARAKEAVAEAQLPVDQAD